MVPNPNNEAQSARGSRNEWTGKKERKRKDTKLKRIDWIMCLNYNDKTEPRREGRTRKIMDVIFGILFTRYTKVYQSNNYYSLSFYL